MQLCNILLIITAYLNSFIFVAQSQLSIEATLAVSTTNPIVQQQSDYIFTILLAAYDPVVAGTTLAIMFPNQYASSGMTSYNCQLNIWPFTVESNVSCSITNRVLILSGAFPAQFDNLQDTIFEFMVKGITNPMYAGTTSAFSGTFLTPNGSITFRMSQAILNINTGSLSAQLTVTPARVSTSANLTVVVTTTHSIPAYGWLRFLINSNTWTRSNSISPQQIFTINPICISSNNTPSNLYCTYSAYSTYSLISVYNINPNVTTPTSRPTNFSFIISTINTPPTTEPQGSFTLTIMNNQSQSTDSNTNFMISGIEPALIMNPSLTLSSYVVGEVVLATIGISISSIIDTNDNIYIQIPSIISLSSLSQITASNIQLGTFSINNNIISFSGISITTSIPTTIILKSITNPSYVTSVGNASNAFNMWITRNTYKIAQVTNSFSYSTIPGSIICTSFTGVSSQAGAVDTYNLSLKFQNGLGSGYSIQITFPAGSFNIQNNPNTAYSCTTDITPSCTFTIVSTNIVSITNIIPLGSSNIYNTMNILLYNITNPNKVGSFPTLQISTYNANINLVDTVTSGVNFVVTARSIPASNVHMTTNNPIVYGFTSLSFTIQTNNPIALYSNLFLYIPSQFDVSSLSCQPYCTFSLQTSSYSVYDFDISSFYNPNSPSLIQLALYNLLNPKSTKPTISFQIYLYNTLTNEQLQYITTGLSYTLCTTPSLLSVSLVRNTTANGQQYANYTFTLGTAFVYSSTEAVMVQLAIPKTIQCALCSISSSNNISYTTFISKSASNSSLHLGTSKQTSITLIMGNHYSLQPQTLQITVLTFDNSYKIASNSISVTNTIANSLTVGYTFNPTSQQYLGSITAFSVTNMTVSYAGFGYLNIQFRDFVISSAALIVGSSQYSLALVNLNLIKLTVLSSSGTINALPFSIGNITTPLYSPSLAISLSTYTVNGYLIDSVSTSIIWQTSCTLPCKQCSSTSVITCSSCYSNPILVQSKILIFTNSTVGTCLSQCPQLYYPTSTNSCQLCSISCKNCIQYDICTSCPSNLPYLLTINSYSSTCYSTCPETYYPSNSSIPVRCLPCSPTLFCLTCDNHVSCKSCQLNYYLYSSTCSITCPGLVTVANEFTWTCDSCPTNCTTCSRNTSIPNSFVVVCNSCLQGYLLDNGRCYTSCVSFGLVPNYITNVCQGCDITCLTCVNTMYNCSSCNTSTDNKYYLNNRCLTSCPNGYYGDSILGLCLKCNAPCEFCLSSSISSCLTCIQNYTLYLNVCKSVCPDGYYQNGSSCEKCPTECLTCSAATICMTCLDIYVLFGQRCVLTCPDNYAILNQTCIQCSNNCKTCSNVNLCASCYASMYLYNSQCYFTCPTKFYPNALPTIPICSACPYQCALCQSNLICQTCIAGYQLFINTPNTNVSCNSICTSGYVPVNGICQLCSAGCLECVYAVDNCTMCTNGYYFYQVTSINTTNNVTSIYIVSGTCYNVCPPALYTYQLYKKCVTACPENTFPLIIYEQNSTAIESKQCIVCPFMCSSCLNDSVCSQCSSGAVLYDNLCYTSCPAAAPFNVSGECQQCNILNCSKCEGTKCIQCDVPYLLILSNGINLCLQSCGDNLVYNASAKQCQKIVPDNSSGTLGYVPMTYCLIGGAIGVIVITLHFTQAVQIYGSIFGILGSLLQASAITIMAVLAFEVKQTFTKTNKISRLLQQEVFGSKISHRLFIVFGAVVLAYILINVSCFILYLCMVRIKRYNIVAVFALFLGCKLFGGLLCSNFYGINMKYSEKNQQSADNKRESGNSFNSSPQKQPQSNNQTLKIRTPSRSPNRLMKYNSKESLGRESENILSMNEKQSVIFNQSWVKSIRSAVQPNNINKQDIFDMSEPVINLKNLVMGKRRSKLKTSPHKPTNKSGSMNQNRELIQSAVENKKTNINRSIKQSSYRPPSQIKSLVNPDLNRRVFDEQYEKKQDELSIQGQQQLGSQAHTSTFQSPFKIEHTQQQIYEEYHNFWSIYDKIIFLHIPLSIVIIVCGALCIFNFNKIYYQFYAGIELIILAALDIITTILWNIWKHEVDYNTSQPNTAKNKLNIKYEGSQGIMSVLSKEKLYPEHDNEDDTIDHMQLKENLANNEVQIQQEYIEPYVQNTRTQIQYNQHEGQSHVRDFKSQYPRSKDVVKLKNELIPHAIQKGVYRHDQKVLADQQYRKDEEDKLDSAQKFYKTRKQQQQAYHDIMIVNLEKEKQEKKKQKDKREMEKEDNKEYYGVIFENIDEQSLDTHPEENEEQQNEIDSVSKEQRKRRDSLGTQKDLILDKMKGQQNQKANEVLLDNESRNLSSTLLPVNKNKKQTPMQIEDIENESAIDEENANKKPKVQKYKNIFQNQSFHQQFHNNSISNPKNKRKVFDEYEQAIEQDKPIKNIFARTYHEPFKASPVKNGGKPQNERSRIIYADLQSVGTAEEYDIGSKSGEEKLRYIQENKNYHTVDFAKIGFNVEQIYKDFDTGNDVIKPSTYIDTNFIYHTKKNSHNQFGHPSQSNLHRSKKVAKKANNNKIN